MRLAVANLLVGLVVGLFTLDDVGTDVEGDVVGLEGSCAFDISLNCSNDMVENFGYIDIFFPR